MDTSYALKIIALSLVAGAATFIGVFIGRKMVRRSGVAIGASFAAGMMACISLLELIPSAAENRSWPSVLLFVALGALVIWLANRILPHIHAIDRCENGSVKNLIRLSYLLAVGLILHDFPEGFAIPGAFQHTDELGWLVIIASFIHNIPEGYVLTVASADCCRSGKLFYKSALFSTLSTVAGATFGLLLLGRFENLNSVFMAVAAGAMLYISWHELLPFIRSFDKGWKAYRGFALAVLTYFFLTLIF